ncbi:hypothetical protein GobsT_30330 [Gemmata obscuriglobus]|uniref:Uncharacterized protein n=1 Tax=Gemmata obscuriglobus TaxID=114 RepID=A0A2Z3H511_9BACT|nr:hypothetical protein [Gemmata obscuriglobus]AWM38767.1 hypothetical protein C1280_18420 [Gemmata obscuriglobus]QEG28257.1 hypothetical protein GobsT_30330 [Gemmata obscuriglobus]VTS06049.1 unnamed protein product [Gemmata obscuriglobus UQM 2246]
MRAIQLILTVALAAFLAHHLPADDPKPPKRVGVVIDLCGPPEDGRCTISYKVTVDGFNKPGQYSVSHGNYRSSGVEAAVVGWENNGFVAEKVSGTRLRLIGWKDKQGKVHPVTGIKIESEDLPQHQLPTVVPEAKNKG